jgi:O-antigen/teichoic acid export membrane protein
MIRLSAFVVFPVMMGLAALAKPFVLLLITEKWVPAIPLLQVLCFALMWYPIHALNLNLLMVRGRSDLFLRLEIIKKVIILFVIFIVWRYGVFWMCVGSVFTSYLSLFVNTYYTGKLINVGFVKQMRDITPTLLYSFSMGALVFFTTQLFTTLWQQIAVGVLVGSIYYWGIAKISGSQDLQYTINLLRENIFHKQTK